MTEGATRCFVIPEALGLFRPGRRIPFFLVEGVKDAATHVVGQLVKPQLVLLGQEQAVDAAGGRAAEG